MTRERPGVRGRRTAVVLSVVLVLAGLAAGAGAASNAAGATKEGVAAEPATAAAADAPPVATAGLHGNHVSTDPQVVANGTVMIESLFLIESGFLVIRADDDGQPGDPIGSVYVESGFSRSVTVDTDDGFWADRDGPVTLHAALHADDGDREFEFGEDDLLSSPATGRAVSAFRAERGRTPAYVSARTFSGQRIAEPRITVSRAALPADGSVVVHAATEELTVGERLGSRSLSAGRHDNVTVPIDAAYLESLPYDQPTRLWVTVHADDEPVTAGGDPVRTLVSIRRVNASGVDDEWTINTPVPTTAPPATTGTPSATDAASTPDDGGAPGPGALATVGVVVGTLLALARRGRA